MSQQTKPFVTLLRGVAERRSTLLRVGSGKKLIYPPLGEIWNPTARETALCDAFILFFVAELESYFEGALDLCADAYLDIYASYFLKDCRAGNEYIGSINKKKNEISRNNNANWDKIAQHFEFFGMHKETHFPVDYWENIESIVSHRGHLAHNGARIKVAEDRRQIVQKIELTIKRTRHFDSHLFSWLSAIQVEKERLLISSLRFKPPSAHIF